jgi:hypothetical protein
MLSAGSIATGSVLFQSGKVVAAKQKHCQSKVTNYAENISVHAEKLSESVPRDILISKPEHFQKCRIKRFNGSPSALLGAKHAPPAAV